MSSTDGTDRFSDEDKAALDALVAQLQTTGVPPGALAAVDQLQARGLQDFAALVGMALESETAMSEGRETQAQRTAAAYALSVSHLSKDGRRAMAALRSATELFSQVLILAWGGPAKALAAINADDGLLFPEESGLNG